uniref:ABC transporter ATP-binding protein n=1 Tax=Geoglobus ahangari TaxID=113653 RepID=A0A7C4WF53_9EURY
MIELIDVYKSYKTGYYEVLALRGINLKIDRGEFVAIMGPSGSGKSTLLYLIGCLDKPTKGRVIIDGEDVTQMNEKQLTEIRRDKIGFIFQQYYLIPTLTALENVELPMVFKGIPKMERKKKAEYLLTLVGLKDKENRKPNELSGGEQQRVAIARALANNPSILLCDEPTGNLDSKSGRQIMDLIKDLNEEMGVTVVLVTHDSSLKVYADRIINIKDGQLC